MSAFQVTPAELSAASGAVERSAAELTGALSAVTSTGPAYGTPAAGAYDALVADAQRALVSAQSAVDGLASALSLCGRELHSRRNIGHRLLRIRRRAMRQLGGGGGSAFGFEVPQGDPGALEQAAASWRNLGVALDGQGEAISAGAQVALGAGGWTGAAAGAFTDSSTRLIGAFRSDVAACGQAATALSSLGHALQEAQQVARQALADCERSQTEMINQQLSADQAGVQAQNAQHAADTAVHPAAKAAAVQAASTAQQAQGTAQAAAGRAENALSAAQARGQQAVSTYETAQTLSGQLRAAAGDVTRLRGSLVG